MGLKFLTQSGAGPAPKVFRHPNGSLHYFGSSNLSWSFVADRMAEGKFPNEIRGNFAFFWDGAEQILAVDHLASYPLFYSDRWVSNFYFDLLQQTANPEPNQKVALQMEFLGGFSFHGEETTHKGLFRVRPGAYVRNGKSIPYLDLLNQLGDRNLNKKHFCELVESEISRLVTPDNVLLLSAGTDSTTIAGILRKIRADDSFRFVHAYSELQPFTELHLARKIGEEMGINVEASPVEFAGDVIPSIRGRQFSFWIENPFPGKRLAVEQLGYERHRIFTGELGDQLFGGPKNSALLLYAIQRQKFSSLELATLWLNQSASFGRDCGLLPSPRIEKLFHLHPLARQVFEELRYHLADVFEKMGTDDLLNKIMLLNYVAKGPYRTWAYSQDELDWVHPFASWEIFQYAFQLRSDQKIGPGGKSKYILLDSWRPHLSDIPWRIPKYGFGIPAKSKVRAESFLPQH